MSVGPTALVLISSDGAIRDHERRAEVGHVAGEPSPLLANDRGWSGNRLDRAVRRLVVVEPNRPWQEPGARPPKPPAGVAVINPRGRVPVSLIIDDSTCLVNLAHFGIPQFHEVFPDQYHQPWKTLPREIPDAFVRRFGEWCAERGIKGKYSLIPYPACVGWLDRDLPGWSTQELRASLELAAP